MFTTRGARARLSRTEPQALPRRFHPGQRARARGETAFTVMAMTVPAWARALKIRLRWSDKVNALQGGPGTKLPEACMRRTDADEVQGWTTSFAPRASFQRETAIMITRSLQHTLTIIRPRD